MELVWLAVQIYLSTGAVFGGFFGAMMTEQHAQRLYVKSQAKNPGLMPPLNSLSKREQQIGLALYRFAIALTLFLLWLPLIFTGDLFVILKRNG